MVTATIQLGSSSEWEGLKGKMNQRKVGSVTGNVLKPGDQYSRQKGI